MYELVYVGALSASDGYSASMCLDSSLDPATGSPCSPSSPAARSRTPLDPGAGSPCSPSSPRHLHLRHRGALRHLPPLALRGPRSARADEGSGGVARCRSGESSGGVVASRIRRAVSSTSTSSCRHALTHQAEVTETPTG
jgi:hypothetical protein